MLLIPVSFDSSEVVIAIIVDLVRGDGEGLGASEGGKLVEVVGEGVTDGFMIAPWGMNSVEERRVGSLDTSVVGETDNVVIGESLGAMDGKAPRRSVGTREGPFESTP